MASAHTSRDFEAELRDLRAQMLAMGARCERSLRLALEAFWTGEERLAAEVEALDREIDVDEKNIDALVLRILALRQPVAYDLRFLTTALKLVTDLERIGDEAMNIAERANIQCSTARERVGPRLKEMSEEAQKMVRDALEAFVWGDVARAEEVLSRDAAIDESYRAVLDAMTAFMGEESTQIPSAISVMKVAKNVERVADHATNIAEEVIFMVRGDDIRHST